MNLLLKLYWKELIDVDASVLQAIAEHAFLGMELTKLLRKLFLSSFRVMPLLLATSVPSLRVAASRSEMKRVSELNQLKL